VGHKAVVHTFPEDGDKVAAFGTCSGAYRATGKSMRADFAHLYKLEDGKIITMHQYVATILVARATS
jgi:ketosteroid isomerase-like protein